MSNDVVRLKRRCVGVEVMKTDSFTALVWNSCKICKHENCPISDRCPNQGSDGSICNPQKYYLENIYSAALDMLGISITTREAVRLGLHIIPLYSILFDLKIASSAIDSIWTFTGAHGDKKINPIYKEIREHIKCIDDMWSKLGYKQLVGHGSSADGDSSYCDNMYVEEQ